tara:strand:- start:10424 stop:10630 length:207 start_codon:yes stop_codon:yes gene_type:complete
MIYLTLIISFIFSNYQLGETISESDQNINFNICYTNDESVNSMKLSDYNGDINGGIYSIVLLDMSATW